MGFRSATNYYLRNLRSLKNNKMLKKQCLYVQSQRMNKTLSQILIIIITVSALIRFSLISTEQLSYPHDLAYERPSSLTMILSIKQNLPLYSKDCYNTYPYIFSPYTPLYHYLVSFLPINSENPFFWGRIIALIFFILTAAMLFFISKPGFNLISFLFFGLFFTFRPIIFEGAYLKNDSMGLFFSVLAIVYIYRHSSFIRDIILASFICVLAFYTKQYFIAAALAIFLYLLFQNFQKGIIFLISLLIFHITGAFIAYLYWGDNFFISIFGIPKNILQWGIFKQMIFSIIREPVFIFLLIYGTLGLSYIVISTSFRKFFFSSPFPLYLISSLLLLISILGSIGGARNYYYEFYAALLIFNYYITLKLLNENRGFKKILSASLIILLICFSYEIIRSPKRLISHCNSENLNKHQNILNELKSIIPQNNKSLKILCLIWPNLTYCFTNQLILSDPFLYSRLWNNGFCDVNNIINDIIDKRFDIIILDKDIKIISQPKYPTDYLINSVRKLYPTHITKSFDYFMNEQLEK